MKKCLTLQEHVFNISTSENLFISIPNESLENKKN